MYNINNRDYMIPIEIFICYSHLDVVPAKTLCRILTNCYGLSVFLADHSIPPSKNWFKDIIEHLGTCEILVPLISNNLRKSAFANQEIGYAIHRNIIILPLRLENIEPFAMLQYTQRLKNGGSNNEENILKAASEISALLLTHPDFNSFKVRAVDSLVQAFIKCEDFITTSGIVFTIERADKNIRFTEDQINLIKTATKENPYIRESKSYFPRLQVYFRKHYNVIL